MQGYIYLKRDVVKVQGDKTVAKEKDRCINTEFQSLFSNFIQFIHSFHYWPNPLLHWRRVGVNLVNFWCLDGAASQGGGGRILLLFFFADGHGWEQKQTWTRRALGQHLSLCPRPMRKNWRLATEEILSSYFFLLLEKKGKGSAKKKKQPFGNWVMRQWVRTLRTGRTMKL